MESFLHTYRRWLLVPVLLLFWALALTSSVNDSITMDEQNHIGRGIAFVKTAVPRLSLEHPPLVNSLSALPLLLMPELDVPFDHPSWQKEPPDVYWYVFADELIWQRHNNVHTILFLSRLPVIIMTLGLALVAYRFALALWQRPSTLLVIPLILFDPNLLAHGRYVTTDMGGTLFVLLATFLLWRMWQAETWQWQRWLWVVIGLGLAFSSKLSAMAFVPIWAGMAIWPLSGKRSWQRLGWYLSAGVASIFVVWAMFGFEWGGFFFKSTLLDGVNSSRGPMPTFWAGIEQITLLSTEGRMAYLNGRFQLGGFRSYFPIAFAIKTPIPTLIGLIIATVILIRQDKTRRHATFLLIPILAYMVITIQSGLNIGYRHLLPMLPFIYILISGSSLIANRQSSIANRQFLTPILTICLISISLRIHPHYPSYFNQLIGGPENGAKWLLDSNVDWGQDLIRLRQWMAENEVQSVNLGWFGTADPAYYDVPNVAMPGSPRPEYLFIWLDPPFNVAAPEPGVYAISASSLYELPLPNQGVYTWFRNREPDDRIGYSIFIYDVR